MIPEVINPESFIRCAGKGRSSFSDYDGLSYHRIREILKLEKTHEVAESKHSPSTAKASTNPYFQVPHPHGI